MGYTHALPITINTTPASAAHHVHTHPERPSRITPRHTHPPSPRTHINHHTQPHHTSITHHAARHPSSRLPGPRSPIDDRPRACGHASSPFPRPDVRHRVRHRAAHRVPLVVPSRREREAWLDQARVRRRAARLFGGTFFVVACVARRNRSRSMDGWMDG